MRVPRNHRVRRNIAGSQLHANAREDSPARFSRTTLVLDSCAPDFSTAEKNSALIISDEIFAPRRKACAGTTTRTRRTRTTTARFPDNSDLANQGGTPM